MTTGSPPCRTAPTEFVVPRSIPIILLIAAIPPETFCYPARRHLAEIKANPAQSLRPKPSSEWSIHVECMFVKLSNSPYNLFILLPLCGCSRDFSTVRKIFLDSQLSIPILGAMVNRGPLHNTFRYERNQCN